MELQPDKGCSLASGDPLPPSREEGGKQPSPRLTPEMLKACVPGSSAAGLQPSALQQSPGPGGAEHTAAGSGSIRRSSEDHMGVQWKLKARPGPSLLGKSSLPCSSVRLHNLKLSIWDQIQ